MVDIKNTHGRSGKDQSGRGLNTTLFLYYLMTLESSMIPLPTIMQALVHPYAAMRR